VGNPGVGLTKTGAGSLHLNGSGSNLSGPLHVSQGTLWLDADDLLRGCSSMTVSAGATLDISALGGFHLGKDRPQTLDGSGAIVGDLWIDNLGAHQVGSSPGVQHLHGGYTMDGSLAVELAGRLPGDGTTGYDQILISDDGTYNVVLGGELTMIWSRTGWSSDGDRLWILHNQSDGLLSGRFGNYGENAALVGHHDGRDWLLYYGADAESNCLYGGNDVVLVAVVATPEPGSLALGLAGCGILGLGAIWRKGCGKTLKKGVGKNYP